MNEYLNKAYDIIVENQRNADTKANVFIVLLTGFLTFVGKFPLSLLDNSSQTLFEKLYIAMLLPLVLLILSLIPIVNDAYKIKFRSWRNIPLNIYHWKSVAQYKCFDDFCSDYLTKYEVKKCEKTQIDLLKQIYVNAMILEYKFSTQKLAFFVIIQFIVLFFSFAVGFISFNNNIYIILGVLFSLEAILYFKIILVALNSDIMKKFYFWFKKKANKNK